MTFFSLVLFRLLSIESTIQEEMKKNAIHKKNAFKIYWLCDNELTELNVLQWLQLKQKIFVFLFVYQYVTATV